MSWFFWRNFAGQKGMLWYMQSTERNKETNKNKLQPMMLNPAGFSFRIQEEKNISSQTRKTTRAHQ